jgi:outer membrane protein assembly factor BamE (lipoprotein component of BamABCDE complex)
MRRAISVLVASFLVFGCSSKSQEEKAVEEAVEALQEIVGASEPASTATVDRETAKAWPEKFCTLEIDMTREQVQAIMGEPTAIYEDSNFNQDQYEAWGYVLTIFYDIDNLAQQIYTIDDDKVPCTTKFRE